MSRKIFWSWQNDYALKANRYLVRDALSIAIKDLNERLELEGQDRLDLDEALKGVTGAVEIAPTIRKKISRAAVFVADITPVAILTPRTATEKGKAFTLHAMRRAILKPCTRKERKAMPNSNVLFELGYALSELGEGRIITILNKASGFTPEHLPFDIRGHLVLDYECKENSDKATKEKEAEKLSKKLKKALDPCLEQYGLDHYWQVQSRRFAEERP